VWKTEGTVNTTLATQKKEKNATSHMSSTFFFRRYRKQDESRTHIYFEAEISNKHVLLFYLCLALVLFLFNVMIDNLRCSENYTYTYLYISKTPKTVVMQRTSIHMAVTCCDSPCKRHHTCM